MTDPDYSVATCRNCLHPIYEHDILEGCEARDNLGNRCACESAP